MKLSKDTASAAAQAAKVASSGTGDLSLKIDYAEKTPGAYPIILVTYEIVCTKYSNAGHRDVREELPDLHRDRRPGSAGRSSGTPRCPRRCRRRSSQSRRHRSASPLTQ